jgi:hypothetical protein
MADPHAPQPELHLQHNPALTALFTGEDRPIEFLTDVKLLWGS